MPCKPCTRLIVISVLLLFVGVAQADFESEVIELVNIERETRNLHPLSYNQELTVAARRHSQDMGDQNYFSHTSQDGREFYERIADAGYDYRSCGENIAAGFATPAAVVDGWMNSDGHRANILDPDYCDIGVGYAAVAGNQYYHHWTQDFGRRAGVTECPEPVAAPPATETPVLSGSSDAGGGGGGGGCFIGGAFVWGKIVVIVKNILGLHNWRGALDAAEDQDRPEEEDRGTHLNPTLFRELNPSEKGTPQPCHPSQ
ncbi:MAG: CAP domain-containing protein [Desulfobacterales bacterium]